MSNLIMKNTLSRYTFRLRAPKGLDNTLIKELNQLAGLSINRSQNININANIESMNQDDIKDRLSKLFGADIETYSTKDL